MRLSTRVCLLGVLASLSLSAVSSQSTMRRVPEDEQRKVEEWLKREDLDVAGNPRGTMYTGGSPLFDESTGTTIDKYEYIAMAHPGRPWAADADEEAEDLDEASAPRASPEITELKATTKEEDEDEPETDVEKESPRFPSRWGPEPPIQTRDYRELPGGYGMGSSTLGKWIETNMAKDNAEQAQAQAPGELK